MLGAALPVGVAASRPSPPSGVRASAPVGDGTSRAALAALAPSAALTASTASTACPAIARLGPALTPGGTCAAHPGTAAPRRAALRTSAVATVLARLGLHAGPAPATRVAAARSPIGARSALGLAPRLLAVAVGTASVREGLFHALPVDDFLVGPDLFVRDLAIAVRVSQTLFRAQLPVRASRAVAARGA